MAFIFPAHASTSELRLAPFSSLRLRLTSPLSLLHLIYLGAHDRPFDFVFALLPFSAAFQLLIFVFAASLQLLSDYLCF
jgi:hypothetical protein